MNIVDLLEQVSEHVKKVNKLMGHLADLDRVLDEVNIEDGKVYIHNSHGTTFVDIVLNPNIMDGLRVTLLEAITSEKGKTEVVHEKAPFVHMKKKIRQ